MIGEYVAPTFHGKGFHCPHCGVYAHQQWHFLMASNIQVSKLKICYCARCGDYSLWVGDKIYYPTSSTAPLPLDDIPQDIKEDFIEARNIVNFSPRASCALLRLALQKLMPHLKENGDNLNVDIADLVKKGLPVRIQKALDTVRVIGNNAVHPGQIDLKDDVNTAIALFSLLNMIVDDLITKEKEIDEIYGKLPDTAKCWRS